MMNPKIKNLIKFTAGIIIILVLIYKIGISNIFEEIRNLNKLYLLPLLALYPILVYLSAINLKVLIKCYNKIITTKELVNYYLISYSLGLLTPANIGELYIIKLLKKHNFKSEEALMIILFDKLITLKVLAAVSIIGCIGLFKNKINIWVLLVILAFVICVGFFIISNKMKKILKVFFKRYKNNIENIYKEFNFYIKTGKKYIILNFILTIFKWLITSIGIKYLILGFDYNIPIIIVFVITCTARLISLIPITISGIGIKELIAVGLYSQFGIPADIILSVYLIYLVLNYSVGAIVILLNLNFKKINEMP